MTAGNSKKAAPGRPFQPGQSGNPNGRPKIVAEARQAAQELAAAKSPWAVQQLIEIAADPDNDAKARVAALNSILDRGCGKVALSVETAEGATLVGLVVLPAESADE